VAIVKMNSFTLYAFESHRDNLLKELQKTGVVHFKNLQAVTDDEELADLTKVTSDEGRSYAETQLAKVNFAILKTQPYYEKPAGAKAVTELDFAEFDTFTGGYDYNAVYETVKELDERGKLLKSEKAKLKTDSEALGAWLSLDVTTKELDGVKNAAYLIGALPKQSEDAFTEALLHDFPCSYVEFLDSVKDDIGLLIITFPEYTDGVSSLAKAHGFTKANLTLDKTPREVVKANDKKIAELEEEEAVCLDAIKEQASHYPNLQIACDYFKTIAERHKACGNFLKTKNVFIVSGYFAESDEALFETTVAEVCGEDYYLETEAVAKDSEDVPIKLKNNYFVSAFEGITEMYSMPKYNEIDPTPLLMPFYILFFAVMLGDAGYGLVLAIGAFIMGKRPGVKAGTKRFMRFFVYLGIATILIGIVFGSLFGYPFFNPIAVTNADGTVTYKPIIDLQNEIMKVLIMSIAIGVFQIIFGLCVKGYMLIRDGKVFSAIFDALFWILAVLSLIGLIVSAALAELAPYSGILRYVLAASLVGLALTQGRSSPSVGGKIGNGIYSVYNITGYVGDLVSYSRLMAIALAGAYIAYSFNLMAGLVAGAGTGIKGFSLADIPNATNYLLLVPAALIAIFGAALDLGLGALGAYVHSCRLQYVEFFGKFYEGGGLPFKPFELKNSFINIKK